MVATVFLLKSGEEYYYIVVLINSSGLHISRFFHLNFVFVFMNEGW